MASYQTRLTLKDGLSVTGLLWMVAPEWFFSTLAQASAAIVGFIVALAAIVYSLERQRRDNRSDRLREALIRFKNRYYRVVRAISLLAHEGGVTTKPYLKEMDFETDALHEKVSRDSDQRGELAPIFWAHARRVLKILDRVNPEGDYLLTAGELDALRKSIYWMKICVQIGGVLWEQLYRDLTNQTSVDVGRSQYREDTIRAQDPTDPGNIIERWLKHDSGGEHREWAGYSDDDAGLTGQNMFSLATVLQYLSYDIEEIEARRVGTLVDYNPNINKVLAGVAFMTVVGVFIPSIFLMTTPTASWPVLRGPSIASVQVILLILTGLGFIMLLWLVRRGIQKNLKIRDTD